MYRLDDMRTAVGFETTVTDLYLGAPAPTFYH